MFIGCPAIDMMYKNHGGNVVRKELLDLSVEISAGDVTNSVELSPS
jgi:hypothetical protein